MEPFKLVSGGVSVLMRDDIDTDQIIPARYMKKIERSGFGEHLFADIKETPGFNVPKNPILVSGVNFGCGSSREHAPWALEDFGFRAVIAPSFADIFRTNCTKIGLLPVQLPEADVHELIQAAEGEPGARAEVDLEAQVVRMPGGREVPFEIDPVIRERLLNGWDDIALTLAHEDEITAYERDRERQGPVTTPFA